MKRLLILVVWSAYACASTYYVSSSAGNDSNSGTSTGAPWKTLAKVNGATFAAGDRILLARGDVWRETLSPGSNGASGNPIVFDAYGTGAAPEITSYQALPTWTLYSGNVWSAPVTAAGMNYVLFGTIWGTKQTSLGALAHDRDFFLNNNTLYVWAPSNPGTYYGSVAAMVLTNTPLISVNGKTYLTFQHLKVDWFDQYGVYVSGASDHLVFANMEVEGMIPAGAMPLGFYVNANTPGDVQFINADAHMSYDGFRFDGTLGTSPGVQIVNARAYFNRNYGIDNTTGGHVTYSYSHLYGNGIAVLPSTDVNGAVEAGGTGNGHNVAPYTAPVVNSFARYPARISYTIDDEGKSLAGADYIDSLLPQFTSRNLKLSIAVVTGEQYASGDIPRIQGWFNAGHDINSHSWSHNYYDGPTMLTVSYAGTSATMTIGGSPLTLSTSVTGGTGQGWSFDLTSQSYSDFTKLVSAINAKAGYTATLVGLPHGHSVTLANVTGVNINCAAPCASPYQGALDPQKFVQDEMATSASWLLTNVSGLPSSELVYVYPSGKENYQTQLYAAAAGYKGARGSLSMGQAIAGTFTTNSGAAPNESNVRSVYGYGVNLQNITSLGASGFSGKTATQIGAQVASLVAKAKAWGVPYGLFTHPPETGAPELTTTEVGAVLDGLIAAGATVMTNTQLVDFLASQAPVTGSTLYVSAGTGATEDLRETASSAATVASGANQGATYALDLGGTKRPASGAWDIGSSQILWTKHGSGSGAGHFTMGGAAGLAAENAYCSAGDVASFGAKDAVAALPQACVYTAMAGTPSPGMIRTVNSSNCNDTATGLQATINAAAAGDTIVIPAINTCQGAYTLPAKTGADRNHWITVRTDQIGAAGFPAEGVQATPCQINVAHEDGYPDYPCTTPATLMPTLIAATGTNPASPVTVTGSFYRFIGLNITKPYGTSMPNSLVTLDGSDHVILDRLQIHGDNWDQHTPNRDTHAGVSTRGTYQAIINSWVYDIDWNQPDGYAVSGGTGGQPDEGPIKLYNDLLVGASETWLLGGGAVLAWPHDYEIRRNLSMKPLKWMLARGATTYLVSVNVKNLGEFKHGHRVLYEDNVFLNNWAGQADQWGEALLLIPKNQATQITNKYVNTNGTAVSCASNTSGTACAAGTGIWGNNITGVSRTGGVVAVTASANGANPAWPYYNVGQHIVLQGLPHTLVGSVYLDTLNGEWIMGCLNSTTCTSGYGSTAPYVIYLTATDNPALAGPDFAQTATTGIAQDFTVATCADTGHCRFSAPKVNYPAQHIAAVVDTEHITTTETFAVQTGVSQATCRPGLAPNAQIQDFTARYNYITHSTSIGLSIDNAISGCADITRGVSQVSIHDNLADDIDAPAWSQWNAEANSHGATGPKINNGFADSTTWPHDVAFVHNTWAGMRGWPGVALGSNWDFAFNVQDTLGTSYYANLTYRDNIFPGPMATTVSAGGLLAGGLTAGFSKYLCNPSNSSTCTWLYKNNLVGTAVNGSTYLQQANTPYPATNPDSSSTCTLAGGCTVTDFSGVFTNWNGGMGNTRNDDYHVTSAYKGAASDGKDLGADVTHISVVKASILPTFTYNPLTIATTSLTACTNGTYCEQQLLISSGASGPNGFVQWHLTSGTLPTGMGLANGDGYSTCQVNGSYSKTGTTGCAGWIYGTPTQSGSFPLMFQAEDAAHQKASVTLTLTVNTGGTAAASCSQTDVAAAIASASAGSTISVPAGTCTWATLAINKAVTLSGAGTGVTNITLTASASPNIITKQATGPTYVKGFSFAISSAGGDLNTQLGFVIQDGAAGWRGSYPIVFQNDSFDLTNSGLFHMSTPGGVIFSHDTFTGHALTTNGDYPIHLYDLTDAAGSWSSADTLGARDTAATLTGTIPGTSGFLNTYIEDSTFTNIMTASTDIDDGVRIVIRHNTFTNSELNSHGKATSPFGIRHWEIYNNNFLNTASEGGSCDAMTNMQNDAWLKGGTGVIFNNTSDNLNTSCWGNKPEVYFALDTGPNNPCPSSTASYPMSHQLGQNNNGTSDFTDPIYLWNNSINAGTGSAPYTFDANVAWMYGCSPAASGFLQAGRDYVDNSTNTTAKPGYTAYTYPHPLVTP